MGHPLDGARHRGRQKDGYRQDCSGYASMALGLPTPGTNTVGLATHRNITRPLSLGELKPGDLLIDAAGRKPLAPLPDELSGPMRDFVAALRRMHGELGYSLKELEGRLPASRSSLSRYLRGQSLPDERLLVQWCKLSFTGADRLPALVELLHRALEAADAGERGAADEAAERDAASPEVPRADARDGAGTDTAAGAGSTAGRRRVRLVLAALGAAAVIAAAALAVPALTGADGATDDGDRRTQGAQAEAPAAGSARITVHNVERNCQHRRTENCALGLAGDPYRPYRRSNIVGHVRHGDVLHAVCRIADGVTVTDEVGGHSSMWFRVAHDGKQVWVPGIRIRPEQLENTELPSCPD
ncbi:helix-turn-helix domain-containing protein [Streptomyces sp. NRRL S-1813]|uniref:helix-turn-helix domain-containing protein n=1 Tax=Streptomyces sp. NRRL S-1813 TaxID=1463888 RepID=UPI000A737D5A|nr:helix-turn-helix transcriptional regulator [Streptomyces sp. NRRL S-1813]